MARNAKRIKASAAVWTAQTKDEVIAAIKQLGDLQRELIRTEANMKDALGEITAGLWPVIEEVTGRRKEVVSG